jgi:signal peptidase I
MKKKGLVHESRIILEAIAIALLLRTFVVEAFRIPSNSMLPTLQRGDHILVLKLPYGIRLPFSYKKVSFMMPKRGDIIVFFNPETKKHFVKRVIGLPKEEIFIKNKKIYIENELLIEDYIIYIDPRIEENYSPRDNWDEPRLIPPDCFYLLGDNRDNSHDSRFFGFVEKKYIVGRAFFRYWPPWRIGWLK